MTGNTAPKQRATRLTGWVAAVKSSSPAPSDTATAGAKLTKAPHFDSAGSPQSSPQLRAHRPPQQSGRRNTQPTSPHHLLCCA
ncbi:hypothetical protein WJX82_002285 [Trebouxia sp. C0006]